MKQWLMWLCMIYQGKKGGLTWVYLHQARGSNRTSMHRENRIIIKGYTAEFI